MMRRLRKGLFQILGLRRYLALVSRAYMAFTRLGGLKKSYPELFFLDRLVQPGFHCIDIGANLGYYTVPLSRRCGPSGRIWAVEPVPVFADILESHLRRLGVHNVDVLRVALGAEKGRVQMGTPEIDGVFRHGRTHVLRQPSDDLARLYTVPVEIPDSLFAHIERLDFVKCDVEGYEAVVFSAFTGILDRFRPVLQIEITGAENRRYLFGLLEELGYRAYLLRNERLNAVSLEQALSVEGHDFYFLPDKPARTAVDGADV